MAELKPLGRSTQDGRMRVQIARVGLRRRMFQDLYHQLLEISWLKLMVVVLVAYGVTNTLFALLYLAPGGGIENARPGNFTDAFFFSVQTMATIGYGKLVPISIVANVLVTLESLLGLLGFAVMTGLIFAKFARPTAGVVFSNKMVITVFEGKPCLLFRMANERTSQIVEAQLRFVLLRSETTAEGQAIRRLIDLHLERAQNAFFALSWTAVHPINERSPLHGLTPETLAGSELQFVASLVGIEEVSGQTVHSRYRYDVDDIQWNMRFVDIIGLDKDGGRQIDYGHFHDVQPAGHQVALPVGAPPALAGSAAVIT